MSKYIQEYERYIIETMLQDGKDPKEISKRIGKHYTTIYREIKRGTVIMRDGETWLNKKVYCADVAQRKQEENGHNKGIGLKLGNDYFFVNEITRLIKEEKYSPYAALVTVKNNKMIKTNVCVTTLYSYIYSGLFMEITKKDLPYRKKKNKKNSSKRHSSHNRIAKKIEERPSEVDSRDVYGHWEMDTVYSGKNGGKDCILVLTERKTRDELLFPLPDRTAVSVVGQLDRIERACGIRAFRNKFKTITCDNGMEFSDYQGIERSIKNNGKRTEVYFCHPFCSSERGSNENQNKLIRRHIPKGADISNYSKKDIEYIQDWINNYPRKMYGGMSVNAYKYQEGIP